jgi:hypothetical protein
MIVVPLLGWGNAAFCPPLEQAAVFKNHSLVYEDHGDDVNPSLRPRSPTTSSSECSYTLSTYKVGPGGEIVDNT